jgi:hypothetical protein
MTRRIVAAAFGIVMGLVFVLSAAVQYNDPDPLPWILIYGAAAVVCAAFAVVPVHSAAARVVGVGGVVVAAVAGVWAITLLPDAVRWLDSDHDAVAFTMKTGDVGEELARECGGLTLVVVANVAVAVAVGRRRRRLATT